MISLFEIVLFITLLCVVYMFIDAADEYKDDKNDDDK